jgi:hypothetical protein
MSTNYNQAHRISTASDEVAQFQCEGVPTTAVVTNLVLKLQDPRIQYHLYLPERLFAVAAVAQGNDDKVIATVSALNVLFPGLTDTPIVEAVLYFDWVPAS